MCHTLDAHHTIYISVAYVPSSNPKSSLAKTFSCTSSVTVYKLSKNNFSFSYNPPRNKRPAYSQIFWISCCIFERQESHTWKLITPSLYLTRLISILTVASLSQHNRQVSPSLFLVNSIIFFSIFNSSSL